MEVLSYAMTFGLIGAATGVLASMLYRHGTSRAAQRQREKDLSEINEAKFQADNNLCRARISEQALAQRQLQAGYQAAWKAGYNQAMNAAKNQWAIESTWSHARYD